MIIKSPVALSVIKSVPDHSMGKIIYYYPEQKSKKRKINLQVGGKLRPTASFMI